MRATPASPVGTPEKSKTSLSRFVACLRPGFAFKCQLAESAVGGWDPSVTFCCSGLSLAGYEPRLTRVHVYFYQVGSGPTMPPPLAAPQSSAEACGACG